MLKYLLPLVLSCVTMTLGDDHSADPAPRISSRVMTFLQKHCTSCHGPEEQNAEVRFDQIATRIEDETVALQWQDILDVLNLGQMPPEGVKRPGDKELADVLETLTADLRSARAQLTDTGGHVVLRRLNRREYHETIKALFGVPVEVAMLPEDDTVGGFDTLGQAHGFSSLQLERYLELGRRVLDRAIITDKRPRGDRPYRSMNEVEGIGRKIREEIPRLQKKVDNFTKSISEGRDHHRYRREITKLEVKLSESYLAEDHAADGVLIPYRGLVPHVHVQFGNNTFHGQYRVRVRCGAASENAVDNLFMKVVRGEYRSKVPDAIDYCQITGTTSDPQIVEFMVEIDDRIRSNRLEFRRRNGRLQKLSQFEEARDYFFKYKDVAFLLEDEQPDLWIDWVQMEGPLPQPTPPPLSQGALLADVASEKEAKDELSEQDARTLIERFAWEAFRHEKADDDYVDRLLSIFRVSREHGAQFDVALKDALVVILASPRFLFLNETQLDEKRRPLTDRELAVRLSYFLWSGPPDRELYELSDANQLRDPDVLRGQVDRMLASDRSNVFVQTFVSQWLELDRLGRIAPESAACLDYDDAVQRGSRKEVFAFFRYLLEHDMPTTNLSDSDFVVVNGLMAQFYGLGGATGDTYRHVAVHESSQRGGLLGQSAILALTGTGDRTSPVERGAYVLRKLMNRPPPPAPANVPMLNEEQIGDRSIKETLAAHMNKAQCNSCHRRIDPLGFAMENFDPVGRWRTSVLAADGETEFPIDASGTMPDGKGTFGSFLEMKRHLSRERDPMLKGLCEAMMTYALGRTIGFSDRETVEKIVAKTAAENYGLRTLVHNIVASQPFQSK